MVEPAAKLIHPESGSRGRHLPGRPAFGTGDVDGREQRRLGLGKTRIGADPKLDGNIGSRAARAQRKGEGEGEGGGGGGGSSRNRTHGQSSGMAGPIIVKTGLACKGCTQPAAGRLSEVSGASSRSRIIRRASAST